MKNWRIDTYDYGTFYRRAKSAAAAVQRVVYAIFGRGYTGWAHDFWSVREVPAGNK